VSSNLTVGKKLILAIGGLVCVVGAVAASSLYATSSLGLDLHKATTITGKKLLVGDKSPSISSSIGPEH
jgi:hypothetical protein